MENYKVEIFDENTFKSKGIVDTQIPEILVKTIQESLDKTMIELPRTGVVINEENLTPSFVTKFNIKFFIRICFMCFVIYKDTIFSIKTQVLSNKYYKQKK